MCANEAAGEAFYNLYVKLHRNLRDGISNIFLFKEQAAIPLKGSFGKKPFDLSGPLAAISTALSSRVEPSDASKFFTEKYQSEVSEKINALRKIRFSEEVCANWQMTFVLLGRFIEGANKVFADFQPSSLVTSTNGGVRENVRTQVSVLKNLWFSLDRLESLFSKVDDDLDKSYEHVFFKRNRIEKFESRIVYDDLFETMVLLKRHGFFVSRRSEYYEKELGKEAVDLIRDFLSLK